MRCDTRVATRRYPVPGLSVPPDLRIGSRYVRFGAVQGTTACVEPSKDERVARRHRLAAYEIVQPLDTPVQLSGSKHSSHGVPSIVVYGGLAGASEEAQCETSGNG